MGVYSMYVYVGYAYARHLYSEPMRKQVQVPELFRCADYIYRTQRTNHLNTH